MSIPLVKLRLRGTHAPGLPNIGPFFSVIKSVIHNCKLSRFNANDVLVLSTRSQAIGQRRAQAADPHPAGSQALERRVDYSLLLSGVQ